MFLTNCNLRKRLGMSRLMEADTGSNGGADAGNDTPPANEDKEAQKEEKTFTQADVDKLIQDRIAREKKNQLSKDELKAYNDWKESQKTEEEKKNEALTNAEKARVAAEEKATALEAKVTCLSKGVIATSVDDVVVLAKAMVTEEITIEQAIDKVLEKYPSFKGEQQQQEDNKGFKVGAGSQKQKENPNDALARAFGNK
nr:MAG TPA: Major capsid protein [Caudoviricetes sp.]